MVHLSLTIKGLCCFIFVVLGYELIVWLVNMGRFGLLFGGYNISLGSHLKGARQKLMISKPIQELKNFPLRIIPDERNLVLHTDYFLRYFIPCILHHECILCHDDGRYKIDSLPHQIIIIEHGALSFILEESYFGSSVTRNTPCMDHCYDRTAVLYIR